MRKTRIGFGFAAVGLAMSLWVGRGTAGTVGEAREPETERPVLRTQQFERGELRLAEVDAERLEAFLRDLNHRRDNDFAQNNRQPGPDNAYLTQWVKNVMKELFTRGYYVDRFGDLHRPGPVVATR